MNGLVVDASVALTWALKDENSERATTILKQCQASYALVPSLFRLEVLNGLVMSERRGRLDKDGLETYLTRLDLLDLRVTEFDGAESREIFDLARVERLTVYDASYLYLAHNFALPLASFDAELRRAATRQGVLLL